MVELSITSKTEDIVDRFRPCTSFECFQLGLPDKEPVKLTFGGKDKCGGIYMSLGIHNHKLVDCEVLAIGDFGLTVFTPESWSSVAEYFFTSDSGFDVSCVQLSKYSWNSLRNQEELAKCLQEMDSLGSKASATFYHLTNGMSRKIPKGCAFSLRNLSDQFTYGIVTFGVDEMEVPTLPRMFHLNFKLLGSPQLFEPFEDEKMLDNVSLVFIYDSIDFEMYRRIDFPDADSVSMNDLIDKVVPLRSKHVKRKTIESKGSVSPVKKKSKIVEVPQENEDAKEWVGCDADGCGEWFRLSKDKIAEYNFCGKECEETGAGPTVHLDSARFRLFNLEDDESLAIVTFPKKGWADDPYVKLIQTVDITGKTQSRIRKWLLKCYGVFAGNLNPLMNLPLQLCRRNPAASLSSDSLFFQICPKELPAEHLWSGFISYSGSWTIEVASQNSFVEEVIIGQEQALLWMSDLGIRCLDSDQDAKGLWFYYGKSQMITYEATFENKNYSLLCNNTSHIPEVWREKNLKWATVNPAGDGFLQGLMAALVLGLPVSLDILVVLREQFNTFRFNLYGL